MRKTTLTSVLILATICGVPAPVQAHGFPYGYFFGAQFSRACPWPGFFLSGAHLGLGPGYPGLFPAWSPYDPWGGYGVVGLPYWTPPVTVVILHVPHFVPAAEGPGSDSRRSEAGPAEGRDRGEMARGIASRRPAPELDTDLDELSVSGGYTARLYYRGKFYSASETFNRQILSSGITVWQHSN